MKRRHYLYTFVVLKNSAQSSDSFASVQQILHCGVAHNNDHFWLSGLTELANGVSLAANTIS